MLSRRHGALHRFSPSHQAPSHVLLPRLVSGCEVECVPRHAARHAGSCSLFALNAWLITIASKNSPSIVFTSIRCHADKASTWKTMGTETGRGRGNELCGTGHCLKFALAQRTLCAGKLDYRVFHHGGSMVASDTLRPQLLALRSLLA